MPYPSIRETEPHTGRRVLPHPEGPNLSKPCVLCYHQACYPTTCPINCIAGKKHRQLARQVGGVVKINSSSLMAPFDINAITFILGKEFIFGSFNFVAGLDGRLHVSNLETIRPFQIRSDSASYYVTRSSSKSDSDLLENGITPPRYLFGFSNSANVYQHMLRQIMGL